MNKQDEEAQVIQAQEAIKEFTKIFMKNYPLVFKNGRFIWKTTPSRDKLFPYTVSVDIKVKP